MFSWIFNTLSHRVNQEEKEWKRESDLRREYDYGIFHGNLIYLSRKPIIWAWSIFTFFGILTFTTSQFPVNWLAFAQNEFNTQDLVSYFSILWGVQATMVALIYPIVIGFVSMLLQRRYSAKSYLNIYLNDTAALLSGLCAIGLIFLMALQYFFVPSEDSKVTMTWLFIDVSFLVINLILIAHFLYQTFEYVKPVSRVDSFKKYLINLIWPEELKRYLSILLFTNSINEKLLQVHGVDKNFNNNDKPTIWTQRELSSEIGKSVLEKNLTKDSELVDVRFRLLTFVAKKWAKDAQKKSIGKKERQIENHTLVFPLSPGITYSGATSLCKIQGSIKLSWFQRKLIKWSFKFKKKSTDHKLQVEDLLDDLTAEVLRSMRSGETQTFSETLQDLIEFLILLIRASVFRHAETFDNYSRIVNLNRSFFAESIYKNWFKSILKLYEPATNRIGSDDMYIDELIYVPKWLFVAIEENAHIDILHEVLALPKYLNYRINAWWLKTIENQGIVEHNGCHPVTLRPPYNGTYENILRSFIGHWESLKNDHFIPPKEEGQSWSLFQTRYPLFESHLNNTCELLLKSIYNGDKSGTKYFLDTLLKWCSEMQFNLDFSARHLIDNSHFINLEHLTLDWDKIEEEFDFGSLRFMNHEPPNLIFSIAIENYWIDICCVLLYKLSRDAFNCNKNEESLIADTFKALFYGEHPIQTGSIISQSKKTLNNANDFFEAVIRQYYSGFYTLQQYRKRLDNFIERISPFWGSQMIPGRSYSSSIRGDLHSLRDGLLFTLILLAENNWDPVNKYSHFINTWINENLQQVDLLTADLQRWITRLQDDDFEKYEHVYEILSKDNNSKFQESRESAIKGLKSFKEKIDAIQIELIKSSDIDEEKLIQIEKWSSEKPFKKASGLFPVPLFNKIDLVGEELKELEYKKFINCQKGWFTEPTMVLTKPGKQLYENLLLEPVSFFIGKVAFNKLPTDEVIIDTSRNYWQVVKEFENTLSSEGKTPILIAKSVSDCIWLRDVIYSHNESNDEISDDLEYSKDSEITLKAYLGNINKTEIYRAPNLINPGTSILMAKESFSKLKFSRNENGNLVSVIPIIKDDPTIIDLKFVWYFDVTVESTKTLLLKHYEL